jgi:NADPH-dependent 2,4-dienoyl-CoA reductase/sulfur reductase-like enzyme
MKRRRFLTSFGVTGLGLSLFGEAKANALQMEKEEGPDNLLSATGATGKVVVVGGGMAGTTVAKYLRFWGGTGMDVTLVEANTSYISNIFSNMVLTGERTLSQLTYNYANLTSKYGVKVVNSSVTSINPIGKTVTLANGTSLTYDRLVLAPGIDFEPLPNLTGTQANKDKIVHAWKAGAQTTSLKSQIQAMTSRDTFILTIPPKPYRCPPGPYERACIVADYLKRIKGGGKVIVLDANPGIQAEVENFTYAFNTTHKGIITYVPNAVLTAINADTMTVSATVSGVAKTYTGKVINAIPVHKAGSLVTQSGIGLANDTSGKWGVVNVLTYESTAQPNIHIIGDSSSTTQPKAGHIANAEAKVCADAIIKLLQGLTPNQTPVTNSSCFTPITKTTASWFTAIYRYNPATGQMYPATGPTESRGASSHHYEDMLKWFNNLMADTFS